jgi:ABC-type phosphate transport system permease subunit
MYKAHARHLLSIALAVYLVAAVIQAVFTGLLGVVGALLAAVVSIVAGFLLQATLIKAVEDVRDGRVDLSFGETLQAADPRSDGLPWPPSSRVLRSGSGLSC